MKNIAAAKPECIEVFLLRLKQKLKKGARQQTNTYLESPKDKGKPFGTSSIDKSANSKSQTRKVVAPTQRNLNRLTQPQLASRNLRYWRTEMKLRTR